MSSTPEALNAPVASRSERRTRTAIIAGAVALLSGIALAVAEDELGRWLTVGGLLTLFVSLHRLGRQGPDR